MNNLSWFLYFADVVTSVTVVICIISAFGILAWSFGSLFCFLENGDTPRYKPVVIASLILLFAQTIPSKETIYLIAGSEAGESVATSEQGQKVLNDIQEIIDYQLNRLKEGEEE